MTYILDTKADEQYREFLDEINPIVTICGMEYLPSTVLEQVDPIAYRCGFNDWLDSENLVETDQPELDGIDEEDTTTVINADGESETRAI